MPDSQLQRCTQEGATQAHLASVVEHPWRGNEPPPIFQVSFLSPGEVETGTDGKRTTARKLLTHSKPISYYQEKIYLSIFISL